jgi:hypothetical protein
MINYFSILDAVEKSLPDHWTEVADVITDDGHHKVYVFHDNAAITLAWGKDHLEGQPWTDPWCSVAPVSESVSVSSAGSSVAGSVSVFRTVDSSCSFTFSVASDVGHDLRFSTASHDGCDQVCLTNRFNS